MRTVLFLLLALLPAAAAGQSKTGFITDTPPMEEAPWRLSPGGLEVITTADGYDNFDLGVDNAEPHASSHPSLPQWIFTAWNTNRTRYSTNGLDYAFQAPGFGTGFTMRGDPVTAYDSLGNLYYENMFSASSGSAIEGCKVMRSSDGGQTWVQLGTAIAGVDKNWIACDQTSGPFANYVYTTMTAEGGGNFARSTDFGVTWTNTWTFPTQELPGMMVAVGPNVDGPANIPGGCVYVVTNTSPTANSTYTFFRSTDGGLTFTQQSALTVAGYVGTLNSQGRLVINNARTRPYPFIAADNSYGPYRGRLYLVYASNTPAGDGFRPDIYLQYSTDQGVSWSPRVRVNDNANPEATNEWFPAIWCDTKTGRLYMKWYDMREDTTNVRAAVYGTWTDDGGATFAPNQRISNATFVYPSPACSPNTNCYRGDYDAITSNGPVSVAVWTDFRAGGYGSYASYFPDFAMLLSPAADTVRATDSADFRIRIPSVKLYTSSVKFTASVTPATGVTLEFPDGDSLASVPDSLLLRVRTTNAPIGVYTVTITGAGPGGTPVHRRTVTVRVAAPSITLVEPLGGDVWTAGANRTIRWTSVVLAGPVRIRLSRDGGITFPETLFASTPNDRIQSWQVTGPATAGAKIRVSGVQDTTAGDQSGSSFIIQAPVITLQRPVGGEQLTAGVGDTVRWQIASPAGTVRIELSRDGGLTFPETLIVTTPDDGLHLWVPSGPASDSARIRVVSNTIPGVADTTPGVFRILVPDILVLDGWNLVSLPRIPPDPRASLVFPTAVSRVYTFLPSGYLPVDSVGFGSAYWARFEGAQGLLIPGTNATLDTLDVPVGWSLLGALSLPVSADSIQTVPAGILQGLFGYVPGAGYTVSPSLLVPGAGYWIRTSQAGQIILRSTAPAAAPEHRDRHY